MRGTDGKPGGTTITPGGAARDLLAGIFEPIGSQRRDRAPATASRPRCWSVGPELGSEIMPGTAGRS